MDPSLAFGFHGSGKPLAKDHDSTRCRADEGRASTRQLGAGARVALCSTLLLAGTLSGVTRAEVTVTLVSRDAGGIQGTDDSFIPRISADGRFVAFSSRAANLVPGDTNEQFHVFVKNVETDEIARVSESAEGVPADAGSGNFSKSISADGRFVAFDSRASNLVPDADMNPLGDVFVKDMESGEVIRVSEDATGVQGNGPSSRPSISADGRFVAFLSSANNLVPGETNDRNHVFVKNVQTGEIARASENAAGVQAFGETSFTVPDISADGRLVVFDSQAGNLVPGDTNDEEDVFLKNMETGELVRLSTDAAGQQGNDASYEAVISADGRFVAFVSEASNLVPDDTNGEVDVFVKNIETGGIARASTDADGRQSSRLSDRPDISADGLFVAFRSAANDLVPRDTNGRSEIFVKNMRTGEIERASEGPGGVLGMRQANGSSNALSISADGRFVAFDSNASNLIPGDSNDREDVFLADTAGVNAPSVPGNIRALVYSETAAEVFWSRSIDNGSVLYEISRNGELIGTLDASSVFDDDLQPGESYLFSVTAIDDDGNRSPSATVSFTTDGSAPPPAPESTSPSTPGNLRFAVYSDTAAELFWDSSSDDGFVRGYEITRNGKSLGVRDARSLFEEGLIPGVSHAYTVTAIDNEGNRSPTVATELMTDDGVGGNFPTGIRADVYSSSAAELFWDRPTATGLTYEVERDGALVGLTDGVSFFDSSLDGGTTYRYRIVAIDANGNRSDNFAAASLTTAGGPD